MGHEGGFVGGWLVETLYPAVQLAVYQIRLALPPRRSSPSRFVEATSVCIVLPPHLLTLFFYLLNYYGRARRNLGSDVVLDVSALIFP
jgi:hypothetical protein